MYVRMCTSNAKACLKLRCEKTREFDKASAKLVAQALKVALLGVPELHDYT